MHLKRQLWLSLHRCAPQRPPGLLTSSAATVVARSARRLLTGMRPCRRCCHDTSPCPSGGPGLAKHGAEPTGSAAIDAPGSPDMFMQVSIFVDGADVNFD